MRRIAVVVHAEAQHHVDQLVGGWYDSSLTDKGKRQARQVGRALRSIFPELQVPIVSSDLLRARQTAEIIGEHLGTAVTLDSGFRELSYGVAEGRPKAWLDKRIVPTPAKGSRLDHRVCEGAESRRDLATRVNAAMNEILFSDQKDLVIVTHGFAATMSRFQFPLPVCHFLSKMMYSSTVASYVSTTQVICISPWRDLSSRHPGIGHQGIANECVLQSVPQAPIISSERLFYPPFAAPTACCRTLHVT